MVFSHAILKGRNEVTAGRHGKHAAMIITDNQCCSGEVHVQQDSDTVMPSHPHQTGVIHILT